MRVLRPFSVLALALLHVGALSAQGQRFSLPQSIRRAIERSVELQQSELKVEAARAKLSQAAHAGVLPKLEWREVIGPIPRARGFLDPKTGFVISPDTSTKIPQDLRYFVQTEIELLQPLHTFGKLPALREAAAQGVEASRAAKLSKQHEIELRVKKLYWSVLLAKEAQRIVEEAQNKLDEADQKLEEKLEEGSEEVSQNDRFKLQVFGYEIAKRRAEVEAQSRMAKEALRLSLGLPADAEFDVADEYLEPVSFGLEGVEVYLELARRQRPEVRRLQAGLNAARSLVRVARSDYYPQFFIAGGIRHNFAKDRYDPKNPFVYNPTNYFRPWALLGFRYSLDFFRTRDKVQEAQIAVQTLDVTERLLHDALQLEVRRAYEKVVETATKLRESKKAMKASERWLRSASMTFDIGVGEIKDLLEAFKANGEMRAEYYRNIYEYNVAVATLEKTVGQTLIDWSAFESRP
jgi:outer membrane protein TolC